MIFPKHAILAGITCLLLCFGAPSVSLADDGSANALTDAQYAAFGLRLPSASDYVAESDPLDGYEAVVPTELYLGSMNDSKHDHYEGSFRVMDNAKELSADALNINSLAKHLVGTETALDAHDKGFQAQNATAADIDGDGTDEIAELTLYSSNKQDFAQLSVYDLKDNSWQKTVLATYTLTDQDQSYIQSIDANTSKGFVGLAAGDYDADGHDEIACYVAARTGSGAYIVVFDPDTNSEQRVDLKDIAARFDVTASSWTLGGAYMPAVSLATTSISGQDDLVVNVSNPLKDGPEQHAALAIYRMNSGSLSNIYLDDSLTSASGYRMRFCSAADADLFGDRYPVLVVGGFRNEGFSSDTKSGKLSSSGNMIQLYYWDSDNSAYTPV